MVIRPSHRGPSRLILSMKLPDCVWHLDLEEKGKVSQGCAAVRLLDC